MEKSEEYPTKIFAVKPGTSELWLSIKICFLGIGAIGLVGFIIKLVASVLQPQAATTTTTS